MSEAVLALGSNLGDRLANLRAAIVLLGEGGCTVARRSGIWETAPVPADQPAFLNAVVVGRWDGTADALLALAKRVEFALGRRPGRRWGPRPADIDLLFLGEARRDGPALTLPHPRIAERAFVLAPLAEVVRGPLPVLGETALQLLPRTDRAGLRRTGLRWEAAERGRGG